ncbi:hypothetical protein CRUP_036782 [Coryphaenoides rupestris]|nr:hypothetical protein CRUP_036782 [Coryphaenoides rupestris]
MCLQCDVTKKNREDFSAPPREGAYVHGLFMEGARWDTQDWRVVLCWLQRLARGGVVEVEGLAPRVEGVRVGRLQRLARVEGGGAGWLCRELTPSRIRSIFIRAVPVDKQEVRNMYACPVYKTRQRGPTYIWTYNLKTKEKPSKWTLAGVALLLQI